jgi:long-chain acyl-CoA synthetase
VGQIGRGAGLSGNCAPQLANLLCQTSRVQDVQATMASTAVHTAFTNLAELVTLQATQRPDAVAIVQPGEQRRTSTWSELERQITAVAGGLQAHGLVAGHRVGLLGPNSIEFVIAYFAALRAGYIAVPMNTQSTPHEVGEMVRDSGARVLFAAADHDLSGADLAGVHVVQLSADGLASLAQQGVGEVSSPRDREALAVLLYTAGTSSRPKAAMLTHRALLSHLDQVASLGIVHPETTILAVLPLFHVYGLNAVLGGWARGGARLVIMNGLPDDFFQIVRSEGVNNIPASPALLARMLSDDHIAEGLPADATVVSGAAPLLDQLREEFTRRTGLRVEQGYGLTEAAPGVSATLGGPILGHGHVGRALPGVEIRIGDGSEPAEPGEIFIRGCNLFSGYWPSGDGGPDAEGWFATGDIGYLADNELFLVDRARELIIVNGFNVYPAEVEEAIEEVAGVEAAAVIGQPVAHAGEQVVAFVIGSDVRVEDVLQHCETRLAKFKRPRSVRLVDELPRGVTGKVRKGILRHTLLDAERAEG